VPGQPRTILYAAGDGRLYRCRLTPEEREPAIRRPPVYASGRADPSDPVTWEVTPPGSAEPVVGDPVWPAETRLRRWVFATLMVLERGHDGSVYAPPQLWWLEMSDDAMSIVAAGRLIEPTEGDAGPVRIEERLPYVAVDPQGDTRLVYLERRHRGAEWRLRSVLLEFDSRTGQPRAATGRRSPAPESGPALQLSPLLLSSDGATVYGVSLTGQLAALPVPGRGNPADASVSRGRDAMQP
jgi:hypothetical protein